MLYSASSSMANGVVSGALQSKTVSSHVFQPTTLMACKPLSTSKMHPTLYSPPISASQVVRRVETHLYFDTGDGRLITFFVRPTRVNDATPNPEGIGNLHHIAFTVSHATYTQVAQRLNERGIWNTGNIDRGFMDSIYFRDPNGQLLEMACYKFVPPEGC